MVVLDNVAPLFVESAKELWRALRLSDADTADEDRSAIMGRALLWARTEFYRRLGQTRITQLKATTEVASPSTDAEILRTFASQVELWLVRWRLMQDLPVLFRDQSGESLLQHNMEALVREPGPDQFGKALAALWAQIEDGFAVLDDSSETDVGSQGMSIGPPDSWVKPEPGGSVFHRPQNVWLNAYRQNHGLL